MTDESQQIRNRARDTMLWHWARDLSVCTPDELRERWDDQAALLDEFDPLGYEGRLADHNPLYYLLVNAFFDNDPSLLYPPLHRDRICAEIVDYLLDPEPKCRGLIISVQRESYKTTITHGAVALWYPIRTKHISCGRREQHDKHECKGRDVRIALGHHKEPMASKSVKRLKRKLMAHPWLRSTWPEFCPAPDIKDFDTNHYFDFPCKSSTGSEAEYSIQGIGLKSTETGGHFNLEIWSDATTKEHRRSRAVREEAVEAFQDMVTMVDIRGGRLLYDCTFWHPNDLTQKLLKTKADKDSAEILGIPENTPLYRSLIIGAGGARTKKPLTFPTCHTDAFLEMRRQEIVSQEGSDDFWWLQFQNELRASSMVATDPAWVKHVPLGRIPPTLWRCIFVDPAWKGSHNAGQGDFAAIAAIAFEHKGFMLNRYLLELVHSRDLTAHDGVNEVFRMMQQYGAINVAPEEHGGFVFRSMLTAEANTRGRYLNLIDLKSKQTHKADRIANFLKTVQAGNFYLLEGAPGAEVFLDQYTDFPGLDHEDALDCVSYSCDPNVSELVLPQFNEEAEWSPWEPPMTRRTRYCGL